VRQDLRFALRQLRRTPGITAIAVVSLGLAIGANSTIASVVNAVLLRPLPVPRPSELFIAQSEADVADNAFSYPMIQRASELLAGHGTICGQSSARAVQVASATGGAAAALPPAAQAQLVTGDCFTTLGQHPAIGRLLDRSDDRVLNGHAVAVISDRFWAQAFNRSAAAVGTAVLVNGQPLTIVGVTTPEFFGTTVGAAPIDLWVPALMQPALAFAANATSLGGNSDAPFPPQRNIYWLSVFVRAPAGSAPAADLLSRALEQELPPAQTSARTADGRVPRVFLEPGARGTSPFRDRVRTQLWVLIGMAGLLLALAATNIAGILLARGVARRRELTIRVAVGAQRRVLVRQLLIESLLVAAAGGALGLLLAARGSLALATLMNRGTPFTTFDASPDWRIAAATVVLTMVVGVLAGIIGAWRSTRLAPADALRVSSTAGRTDHSMRRISPGAVLIAGQMALSLVLLVAAALAVRTLRAVTTIELGFNPHHVVVARIDPRAGGYRPAELPALYTRLADSIGRVPGVAGVSFSGGGPFGGSINSGTLEVEGYTPPKGERARGVYERVSSAYVRTLGLQIVSGRDFASTDAVPGRRVSLINESAARRYFDGKPLGRRWGKGPDYDQTGYEVVGVIRDAKYSSLKDAAGPMVYMLASSDAVPGYLASIEVAVAGDDSAMAATLRRVIHDVEPRLPIRNLDPLDRRIATAAAGERLLAELATGFAIVAALLSCLGLYGMLSYGVSRRTSEIGVRMALGAARRMVIGMMVREALLVVLIGIGLGLPLAALLGRAMRSELFGVAPSDPASFLAGTAFLLTVALVAAYVPAYRAGAVEPMTALRIE
jgi:predicted permease